MKNLDGKRNARKAVASNLEWGTAYLPYGCTVENRSTVAAWQMALVALATFWHWHTATVPWPERLLQGSIQIRQSLTTWATISRDFTRTAICELDTMIDSASFGWREKTEEVSMVELRYSTHYAGYIEIVNQNNLKAQ